MKKKDIALMGLILLLVIIFPGCAEVAKVGTMVGEQTGYLSRENGEAVRRLADQTAKAARPMTEQEENYVGRAVAATILSKYPLHSDDRLTRYVNEVGQTVALASDRPFTYGGYHFAILGTEEVNALACPGGIIFITLGMLKRAKNEEELACILAHEVAHVSHKDGLASIQKSRWVQVVTTLGTEAARKLSGAEVAKLVSLFEGSVNDVVSTLLVNGYSHEQENAADLSGVTVLQRLSYNPHSFTGCLERLSREQVGGAKQGIFSTHPRMEERLAKGRSYLSEKNWPRVDHRIRDQRFLDVCMLK